MNTDEELARVKDERDEWEKSCAADMAHYNILAKEHAALTQENQRLRERLQWFQDNGGSYPEQLENELDSVKAQNDRIRAAVEPLIAEVKNLRDTLSASSLELDMQVADGWHALIKPVEAALEGKEGNA
jgi:predicted  nucleic acid-binding Zn-ribbon protein